VLAFEVLVASGMCAALLLEPWILALLWPEKRWTNKFLGRLFFNRDAGSSFRRAARETQGILHLGQKQSVYG
jgi:hypothetical protein